MYAVNISCFFVPLVNKLLLDLFLLCTCNLYLFSLYEIQLKACLFVVLCIVVYVLCICTLCIELILRHVYALYYALLYNYVTVCLVQCFETSESAIGNTYHHYYYYIIIIIIIIIITIIIIIFLSSVLSAAAASKSLSSSSSSLSLLSSSLLPSLSLSLLLLLLLLLL